MATVLLGSSSAGAPTPANSNLAGTTFAVRLQALASGTVTAIYLKSANAVTARRGALYADNAGQLTHRRGPAERRHHPAGDRRRVAPVRGQPGRSRGRRAVLLTEGAGGKYTAPLEPTTAGTWYVRIEAAKAGKQGAADGYVAVRQSPFLVA